MTDYENSFKIAEILYEARKEFGNCESCICFNEPECWYSKYCVDNIAYKVRNLMGGKE